MDTGTLTLAAFILTAIGWISREIWRWRNAKRQAAHNASKILSDKKKLLEEMISKTQDTSSKQGLLEQQDEVNAALLGLHGERLRHTLKEAGLPTEETLIADGRSRLQPQQVARLKEVIAEVKTLSPFISARDLLVSGNAYYYMEQYQDAKNIYDGILNLNPNDPNALNNRGVMYRHLKRYDEALTDLNRILELTRDDPDALTNRGAVYHDLERYNEALADLNRSLELKPDDPGTLNNRGNAYAGLRRYDEALANYNRSLEFRPDDPGTLNNRGVTYQQLERYEESLADLNRSLELEPDDPDTLNNRGVAYQQLERYEESLADLNRSLELEPDDPSTLYNLACLFSVRGKTNDALTHLEKAIALDKKYREMAKTDKDFDNIRDDPRFKELMESD